MQNHYRVRLPTHIKQKQPTHLILTIGFYLFKYQFKVG